MMFLYRNGIESQGPSREDFLRNPHAWSEAAMLRRQMVELGEIWKSRNTIGVMAAVQACLFVHMAKADGVITETEMRQIRKSIVEHFGNIDHSVVGQSISILKKYLPRYSFSTLVESALLIVEAWDELGIELHFTQKVRSELDNRILIALYQVALTDGLKTEESRFFNELTRRMGVPPETIEYLIRAAHFRMNTGYEQKQRAPMSEDQKLEEARKLFQLGNTFSMDDLNRAWRAYAKFNHPDRYHNAEKSLYEKLNRDFAASQEAYERLKDHAAG